MDLTNEDQQLLLRIGAKLVGLGVRAVFSHKTSGPVVSTYYFNLGFEVPISKIMKKEEDIAIASGVEKVLITREQDKIAISIPNKERQIIAFDKCLFNAFKYQKEHNYKLPLILGETPIGQTAVMDLIDAPHLLIAGSTGSGKSILLQSLLAGLSVLKDKSELRMILVDTKKLDLNLFSTLPHVIDNVETAEQFHVAISRLMGIVRKRTDMMKGIARNVTEYNSLGMGEKLPYYVMIIDEVADLIDLDKHQLEWENPTIADLPRIPERLKMLLQICRAAGVHVICATQRSSVDVIKGSIKANLPTRIALRLPSRVDSMTILNQSGAQNLLGKGDMLVESAHLPNIQRYHGAFISSTDIVNVLENAKTIREQFTNALAIR